MEGLEKITAHIRRDGQAACAQIMQAAAEESERIRAAGAQQYAREEAVLRRQMEERLEREEKSRRNLLLMERRQTVLQTKQALVEQAFQSALQSLSALDEGRRITLYLHLLELAALPEVRGTVLLWEKDGAAVAAAFTQAAPQLELSPQRCGSAGFFLCYENLRVDCTFAALLEERKDMLRSEVAAVLFGEEENER